MAKGKVKWFNDKKGYGFITHDDDNGDVFVHFKEIVAEGYKTLAEGESVEFEVKTGPKGLLATNVVKM